MIRPYQLAAIFAMLTGQAAAGDVDVAIVFAVDRSVSVDRNERAMLVEGHAAAIESPQVVAAIKKGETGCIAITYFEWSSVGDNHEVLPWSRICDQHDARSAADVIRRRATLTVGRGVRRGATSVSFALTWASILLDRFPYRAARKVIDLAAEGDNNDGAPVAWAREQVLEKGHIINAIAVVDDNEPDPTFMARYLKTEVIGGEGAFVLTGTCAQDFTEVLRRKLVVEIGALSP